MAAFLGLGAPKLKFDRFKYAYLYFIVDIHWMHRMAHTYLTIIIPSIIAFIVTLLGTKFVITYMMESGVTSIDHNKRSRPTLPGSGGIAVAFGLTMGIFAYIFGSRFPSPQHPLYIPVASLVYLFATVLSVIMISMVGLLDDINVKRKLVKSTDMMDTRKGLPQWQKPMLTLLGAIPLMVVNAGISAIRIPIIGTVNFGILYPLVILPLAIIFAANSFNLMGGFDGISPAPALIASLALLIYSVMFGTYTGVIITATLSASLLAFLAFNMYPAKVLPGDSFTYCVGTALVASMVLGNMESFGVIIFLPWIIEFLLHARKRFKVTDLGKRRSDGTMEPPYGRKIYSWTHLIMNIKRCKEWEVTLYFSFIEVGFVLLAFALKAFMLL
jgi:UDP-N-acetylglucosamine--dolichyl-phosphate N-acetylglucosaminephosphotransferase